MAYFIQSKNVISIPVNSLRKAAETIHRPPPTRVPMPPQEQANGSDSIINFAVLVCGSMPTALINGSIVTMPMAQAAASCIKEEEMPSPMAMIKVNLITLFPAFLTIKYPNRCVRPAFSREMAKIRQHMINTTTGCI